VKNLVIQLWKACWSTSNQENVTLMEKTWFTRVEKNQNFFHCCNAEQPYLEAELKNWVMDHKHNGISVSVTLTISEMIRWASFWLLAYLWRVKEIRNCNSFVGVVTRWMCMICDLNPSWGKNVFSKTSRLALGPTQPSVKWVLAALSLGVKWQCTDWPLTTTSAEIKMSGPVSPTCLHSMYKDNFTCTFYRGLNICICTRIAWDAS